MQAAEPNALTYLIYGTGIRYITNGVVYDPATYDVECSDGGATFAISLVRDGAGGYKIKGAEIGAGG